MATIHIRRDRKRGCGWRSPGGKYLIGGAAWSTCGKLPIELTVCPTCHAGIKPCRSWTWLDVRKFVTPGACEMNHIATCACCPLSNPPETAGLLWIGEKFYPTPEAFLQESRAQGVSRRLPAIPKDFEVGKTLVLLAHRKVQSKLLVEPKPAIFAAFVPTSIEYVVKGDETEEELQRLEKQGCTLVRIERVTDAESGAAA